MGVEIHSMAYVGDLSCLLFSFCRMQYSDQYGCLRTSTHPLLLWLHLGNARSAPRVYGISTPFHRRRSEQQRLYVITHTMDLYAHNVPGVSSITISYELCSLEPLRWGEHYLQTYQLFIKPTEL